MYISTYTYIYIFYIPFYEVENQGLLPTIFDQPEWTIQCSSSVLLEAIRATFTVLKGEHLVPRIKFKALNFHALALVY